MIGLTKTERDWLHDLHRRGRAVMLSRQFMFSLWVGGGPEEIIQWLAVRQAMDRLRRGERVTLDDVWRSIYGAGASPEVVA